MPYYKVCPFCGAHLDPGEKCDCQRAKGELDESGDYAGRVKERQYRNLGEGSRIQAERDLGVQRQQEGGADSF